MPTEKPVFMLIAGALHPAWVWRHVVALLEDSGFRVIARDLPGMGDNREMHVDNVTLADWTDDVVREIQSVGSPVILVGHSRGGLIVGEAAEQVPERVAAIVYVSALVVPRGRTAAEVMAMRPHDHVIAAPSGKSFTMAPDVVLALMYNRSDPQEASLTVARLTPEPFAPLITPAGITLARWGKVPKIYVELTDDRTLTLERQRLIQSEVELQDVIAIDADHSPFLSAPEELARALVAVADGLAERPNRQDKRSRA
ncbi:alpha/beta fold hydrolase [Sphingobium sp. Sx8-8]|uniref:alpha/beta fold hydrolase n=1 Tax=Sphingobium sp. Sx8-8 TaxID=2933617 RepID=UPI001F57A1B7|nr:alpha/beta fold hydrolase [Sphingobium sp. Sx8-8]